MLTTADFNAIRQLARQRAGLVLGEDKRYLVETRLRPVLREFGASTIADLLRQLRAGRQDVVDRIIEALTTNETLFFRDARPFEALREVVLPELIRARAPERQLNIWCAAASTGQEPYSVAMLIREHFPQLLQWKLLILATDISPKALAVAREGLYSQLEVNRGLPAHLLVKYFRKEGNRWRLDRRIRDMVQFRVLNLVSAWPPMPKMDIIFMRNVLIYFDTATKQRILRRTRQVLRPDGYLFLGAAETTLHLDDGFEPLRVARSCCYRPKSAVPSAPVGS